MVTVRVACLFTKSTAAQAIYFDGDQGQDVRVEDIPVDMLDAAGTHRMEVSHM